MASHSPAPERYAARQQGIAVVLTRRVRAERAAAFETGLRELIAAAAQPGQLHAEVLRGTRLAAALLWLAPSLAAVPLLQRTAVIDPV